MIGLILWVIIIGYPALFVWAYKKNKTWQTRLVWCGLLSVPLVAHFWDYPVIYYRHQQACAADGGLRVFVQPERVDRVQLDENSYYFADIEARAERVNDFATPCFMNLRCRVVLFQSGSFARSVG
jgi:hypothetical protein